ncbi:hypothetical protein Pla22_16110 [Rubripirellula amarantea]|uniref:WxL domain-containing protein n=1 Tax=Rubripirellula amarantea TaxID=2527999 RepID=A0A5C5WTI0_9BACT|nr:hypothetical protein [Rubripirellula amarantea]TWT53977.1 hypothetical protein Pla22_16110 [Rubripirellula amarantea]
MPLMVCLGNCAYLWLARSEFASAAETAYQTFSVNVRSETFVEAPENVVMIHDQSESNQVFPTQTWTVRGNLTTGMVVDFVLEAPFIHALDSSSKTDARLNASVRSTQGSANWTVPISQDQTDINQNVNSANVRVQSDAVGMAEIDLNVELVETSQFVALPGNYETTVLATISIP